MSSRHRMPWYNANALIVVTLCCGGPNDCTACIPRTSRRERHETPGARRPNDARGHTRTGRHAMACAHHRDHIPASDNMSSPSAGAGRGAGPLPARGQPRGSARCAPALWSLRRGAASRPASRHVVVRYPSRRARVGCPAATRAGQPLALRSRRGGLPVARGGRTRSVAQAVGLSCTPSRLSWGHPLLTRKGPAVGTIFVSQHEQARVLVRLVPQRSAR